LRYPYFHGTGLIYQGYFSPNAKLLFLIQIALVIHNLTGMAKFLPCPSSRLPHWDTQARQLFLIILNKMFDHHPFLSILFFVFREFRQLVGHFIHILRQFNGARRAESGSMIV